MNATSFTPIESSSPGREVLEMFFRSPSALSGLILFAAIALTTFVGPLFYHADPFAIAGEPMTPPGEAGQLLGSDYLGHSILTGIIYGGHIDLTVGAVAAALAMAIGITVGALAGYYGRLVDEVLMRVTEFFQVMPPLLFAMVLVAVFSPTLPVIAISIGVVSWPRAARIARAEFMKLKQIEFVTAERALGASNARIIWKVILPNALPPLIIQATLAIGTAILFSAGLAFLGLSDPNTMSWGFMIGSNRQYILDAWWAVTIPGLAIFLTVLSVSLIGDGLNDALNPKLRER
jgi:peptide/nickel transport system permease protein